MPKAELPTRGVPPPRDGHGSVPPDTIDGVAAGADEKVSPWRAPLLWFRRGAWAFADQTLFALSNFILNIALARILIPADYGAFTLGYTIFLLIGTVYTSLFIEPMLVFGAGRYRDELQTYVRELIRFHWQSTAIASVALAIAGFVLHVIGQPLVGSTLLALSVANPCILLQWLMRRACYVHFEPRLAAVAGLWYVVMLIAGGYLLSRHAWLTAGSTIALMGVGSLGSAIWIMVRLGIRPFERGHRTALPGLVAEHWRYGSWVIGSGMLGWVPQGVYYLLLPLRGGLQSTAALKALMNLIMPVLHAYQPLLILMIPALVRERGTPRFGRTVRIALLLSVLCSTLYWLVLGLARGPLVAWLYKGQYVEHANLLWIVGLVPITGAAIAVLGSALRALQRPSNIFRAYAMSAGVAVTIGAGSMALWGVTGAVIGIALSSLTTMLTMAWCLWRAGADVPTA